MSDPWELILHHTYRVASKTVYDLSPAHGSPGVVVGNVEYLADGADPASGAISVLDAASAVHVDGWAGWDPLGGISCEVRCKIDPIDPVLVKGDIQTLVWCEAFHLMAFGDELDQLPRSLLVMFQPKSQSNSVIAGFQEMIPIDEWVTVGFRYDGLTSIELYVDGAVQVSPAQLLPAVPGRLPMGVDIGNSLTAALVPGTRFVGQIEDVKIWRRNPHALGAGFLDRPMDAPTAECWARWGRAAADWFERNRECALELRGLLDTIDDILRTALMSEEGSERLNRAAEVYTVEWRKGALGGPQIVGALADFARTLERSEADSRAAVEQLSRSECWRRFLAEVGPPECDSELLGLYKALDEELGRS